MRKHLVSLAVTLAMMPGAALAQADSAGLGSVSGVVYDSVARAPIAGATVQMIAGKNVVEVHSVVSDARGRYVVEGLTPGRYLIGFFHAALDTLALNPPQLTVEIRAGERSKLDLAVPAPARIRAAVCGAPSGVDSTALLFGMVLDSKTRLPLDTGRVRAAWQEFTIANKQMSVTEREVVSQVSKDGWFALCGVPGDVELAVQGWGTRDSTGILGFSAPVMGLARHDLLLGGTATLHGHIRSEKDKPIVNARIGLIGTDRAVLSDSTGAFFLGETPAGSQTLEVRALGFAPDLRPLALRAGTDTTLDVRLTSSKRVLDTIRVVAQSLYNRDSNGFLRRKRMGIGYFVDRAAVERRRPFDISALLLQVPSLQLTRQGPFRHGYLMRGGVGYCQPALFIDGARMANDLLSDLDVLVRPDELQGMEIYRGTNTPPQFTDFSGCGAIVIWTRPARAKQ